MAAPCVSQLVSLYVHLVAGETWRTASAAVGLALSTAYENATQIWPSLRGRRPRLSAECRKAIESSVLEAEGGVTYRQIARRYRVSPDTVSRLARAMVEAKCADLAPVRSTRPYRCPGCGARIAVRPCVFCRAKGFE